MDFCAIFNSIFSKGKVAEGRDTAESMNKEDQAELASFAIPVCCFNILLP